MHFADVYDEQVWNVYAYFAYRVGSRSDAEDLTQVTFERALKAWHRFDSRRASVGTWLMAIAKNALIDHFRREPGQRTVYLDGERWEGREPSIGGPEERLGTEPALLAALATLSDREREVLALRFGGDLGGREIAELLGLSLSNVQQILSRSLRKLRIRLDEKSALATASDARPQR